MTRRDGSAQSVRVANAISARSADVPAGVPLLIALPQGLNVSGVTMWAVRLANGLAGRGRRIALLLHPEPPGAARLSLQIDARIRIVTIQATPLRLENCGGDLSPFLPAYRRALRELAGDGPVIFSPNLHGDCYGIGAALCLTEPELIRIIGWQHSDIEYDTRLLMHYEPIISRFCAVSDAIHATLQSRLGPRAADLVTIPYGIECPLATETRRCAYPSQPIRLLYAGRLEHDQKRILSLVHLADHLARRSISFQMTIVGDGPATAEVASLVSGRDDIVRLPPAGPQQIRELLDAHDAFILPSRYEGLSIAMLEAMARGCIPILTRTRSGSMQAIEPGFNGEIAEAGPQADEHAAASDLADAIARHIARGPRCCAEMAEAARSTIAQKFSLDLHLQRVEQLLDETAASPARPWPAHRPCAFTAPPLVMHPSSLHQSSQHCLSDAAPPTPTPTPTSSPTGPARADQHSSTANPDFPSGSLPADGPARLAALLNDLAGRRIIIHGTGQHTLQLAAALARAPVEIAAFTDDDRQQHGQQLWNWSIIAPAAASATGATDVIISSWMHQDAIWAQRDIYESQGLRVHRLY